MLAFLINLGQVWNKCWIWKEEILLDPIGKYFFKVSNREWFSFVFTANFEHVFSY